MSCNNPAATLYDWGSSEQAFLSGDFNGDGRKDVIQTFSRWSSIPTCYSSGSGWSCNNHSATQYDSDSTEQKSLVADVNGDGRSDVLQTYRRWSSIPVCSSTGSGYSCSNPAATIYDSGSPDQEFLTGDFDGDTRSDVIQTYRGWGSIPLCQSTGSGWSCSNPAATIHNSGSTEQKFLVGDFDGNGRDDVAQVFRGWSSIPVCLSTGSGWSCGNWPATIYNSGSREQDFHVADVNGDGRDDVVQSFRQWSSYPICSSTGSSWNCSNIPATIYNAGP